LGFFDAALPPVCTIKSGETVTINTISGGPDQFPSSSSFDILPENPGIIATLKPKPGLHILTGPVAVEGAEPGDMLEVRIDKIDLRQNWGYNLNKPLYGTLSEDFPVGRIVHIPLDRKRMIATMPWGTEFRWRRFLASWALRRRQATARSVRSNHANMAATSTTRSWSPVQRCSFRFGKKAHCSRPGTVTPCRRRRGQSHGH
jgi:acetamidase/formamidase